jgi:hypothetical protein
LPAQGTYCSALAKTPASISARAGAKEAINNRVKTNNSTSKQHRKLKFSMQYYFNTNKEMKKEEYIIYDMSASLYIIYNLCAPPLISVLLRRTCKSYIRDNGQGMMWGLRGCGFGRVWVWGGFPVEEDILV